MHSSPPPRRVSLSFPATARRAQLLGEQVRFLSPLPLSLSSSRALLRQPPPSSRLSIYLGLPRELPVFRSVPSRQYIFQVLMGRRHMLVLTLIARSILALSFTFSPLLFLFHRMHPRHPSRHDAALCTTDIAIEEDLALPVPRRYYEYKIFRSRTWMRARHVDLSSGMTTLVSVKSQVVGHIMIFNYFFYYMFYVVYKTLTCL